MLYYKKKNKKIECFIFSGEMFSLSQGRIVASSGRVQISVFLFTSSGRNEWEINQQITASSVTVLHPGPQRTLSCIFWHFSSFHKPDLNERVINRFWQNLKTHWRAGKELKHAGQWPSTTRVEHHWYSNEDVCCGEQAARLKGKALSCIALFSFQLLFVVLRYRSQEREPVYKRLNSCHQYWAFSLYIRDKERNSFTQGYLRSASLQQKMICLRWFAFRLGCLMSDSLWRFSENVPLEGDWLCETLWWSSMRSWSV